MFSQSKQSQPTFKIVIRSDLSSASPPNDHKTSFDSAPLAATTPTVDEAAQHRSSIPGSTTAGEGERKRKQSERDGGFLTTKRVCAQLGKWTQKRDELEASRQQGDDDLTAQEQQQQQTIDIGHGDTDYGDYQLMACLLCNRKFKSNQDVTRHQALSDLHKVRHKLTVLYMELLCYIWGREGGGGWAICRMGSDGFWCMEGYRLDIGGFLDGYAKLVLFMARIYQASESSSPLSTSYRNRAAERRQAYHQPERPIFDDQHQRPMPKKPSHVNPKRSQESAASASIPIKDDNIGAKMLKQMGWKKGQGLGKEGTGIANPISAERYAQGVGLGSANAKSRTDGGAGDTYKDRARELARRRLQEEL
ncbi:hypothetical protein [Absidia glauca]|uniref:G-patch domain-containing protein n=1 Tax=Absidia glauca TaxID=4829 RepID=A0A168MSJ0_ABSGL|nr:hypothetical protein [Absidia glauca]